eukprot:GHVU01154220.1.p2 GENE.GHVU01154220.1~~GHVU01154220.1.p2  ORF type:complete len:164 (+),score=5.58 GHVU01154220.1:213-704(+)
MHAPTEEEEVGGWMEMGWVTDTGPLLACLHAYLLPINPPSEYVLLRTPPTRYFGREERHTDSEKVTSEALEGAGVRVCLRSAACLLVQPTSQPPLYTLYVVQTVVLVERARKRPWRAAHQHSRRCYLRVVQCEVADSKPSSPFWERAYGLLRRVCARFCTRSW